MLARIIKQGVEKETQIAVKNRIKDIIQILN
jgi:hypothetical protein